MTLFVNCVTTDLYPVNSAVPAQQWSASVIVSLQITLTVTSALTCTTKQKWGTQCHAIHVELISLEAKGSIYVLKTVTSSTLLPSN